MYYINAELIAKYRAFVKDETSIADRVIVIVIVIACSGRECNCRDNSSANALSTIAKIMFIYTRLYRSGTILGTDSI